MPWPINGPSAVQAVTSPVVTRTRHFPVRVTGVIETLTVETTWRPVVLPRS